ncbi:MAG: outer rane adhesin like protein, partial [Bacteroidetes bacterium]|nr:outer rane adhesin like protein [Bacteroidota bacterium]
MKKFTHGFLAFLFAMASTAMFAQQSSYAYAQAYTPTGASSMKLDAPGKSEHTSSDVTPDVKQAMMNVLRKSTNQIFFEQNAGQFHNPDVMYGFRTHFGSMGVYHNKLRLVTRQGEGENPGEIEKDEDDKTELHIVDITFPGSPNNWTVQPGSKSATIGSYFENGKGMHPDLYNEITLKNVYPGIDLRLYSGEAGAMEFDWLVSKASDYEKIKINFNGQDGLNIGKEGNLEIKLHDYDMKMITPETYQIIDGNKNILKASVVKTGDDKTIGYKVTGKIDPNMPLVIDPVMIWSSFMMNASNIFDEYLYAVASNPAGETYCAGVTDQALSSAYMSGVAAGFNGSYTASSTGAGTSGTTSECVIYKFNTAGTAILAWTYTGIIVTVNNGQTTPLPLVPTDLDIFPNGRVLVAYSQDLVQIYSNTLAAQFYTGSVNSSGTKPANANYQSVCIVDDATFYISGVTTSAYSTIVPANAPDPTFAGTSEGLIMRITNVNSSPVAPLATWGTYVGGSNSEGFASIALSNDHSKLAFAVHTIVGTGYPATTANAVDATPGAAGTTEVLVGVIPVSATPQTAFSVFSYLGGSGDEGRVGDVPQSDKAVVCADNNYFYVGGNTYSTDIPGRATGVQPALKGGIDEFISRIPWNGTSGTGFASTYNGGSKVDLVGGIAVDFRSSDVLLFGTTSSNADFPVLQTTPASPYYQNVFGGGTYDISYGSFSNDLSIRSYGTFIGGSGNDYLGSTGVLRGSGHLFYNLTTGLINIGTTIHSNETSVPVQWITNIPGFDKTGGASGNDNHFIFEWDPNTFDYGDAPSTYEQGHPAKSALSVKLNLGATIDAESAPFSSTAATGDDANNSGSADDEDGVAVVPMLTTGATTYSVSVSAFNNTGGTVQLAGWLDANNNHIFDLTEYATVNVPTSTSQQTITLNFSGLVPVVYGTGNTFLRLRLSDGAMTSVSDTGEIQAGEVEDYQICIKPDAGTDKTVCVVGTATMSATGSGTWFAIAGNPGTATITTPTSPTTTISSFSAVGTYRFLWTNSTGCSDTANVVVTTQPGSVTITPATANICVGNSTVLTASASPAGGTFQWSPLVAMVPANGVGAAVTVSPASTQVYTVVYSLGGCNSSANRTVTVYPVVTADAGVDQTYCSNVSTTVTIGGFQTGSGGSGNFSYAWSPPTRLSATNVANPTITSIVTSTTTYYVTVTDNLTGCTSVDSMKLTINPSVTVSIAPSDTDLCLGQFTSLAATGTPAGGAYSWSPTVGMTPPAGNTATVSVAPSANQTYTVVYSLAGCTNSASKTVNVYPNVTANAGADQTYCLPVAGPVSIGGSPTANGGSGTFTYAWSPNTRLSSTTVANPTITSFVASSITYYVTVTDTRSGCSSVDSMVLTINSQATVSISSPDTNLCAGQAAVLTASGSPAGGTYQWSPLTNMTPGAGNTAVVSVSPPVGSQTYNVTYTTTGCSGTAHKTVNVVSAVVASAGGNQTYCMPYAPTITLGGSPTASGGSGSFSYSWSPATRLSATNVANPTLTSNVASTVKYFVTVTDNVSGCSSVDSMTLTLNPAVIANAGSSTSVCSGSGVPIGGLPAGSGGTGTLTYSWSPGTGLSGTTIPNPTASPIVNTTYTLTVTDSKSCSAISSVLVTVNPKPSADAGPLQTLTDCSAASVSIGGTPATGSGGTPGYTYLWSPTGGLDFSNVSNPNVSHIASNTTYTVTVTDAKGCTAVASVKVNVITSSMQVGAGVNASYCANSGGSATFNGTLTGGTPPFTYDWTPTANLTPTNAISTVANPSAAGVYVYTLNVTDGNGCNASDTVRLDVWPAVTASAGPNVAVCNGFGDTIGGNPTASGGSGSFVYSWSPGTGLNSTAIANPIATPATNTPYSVTVTDLHNCSATSSVFVTVNANPVAHAGTDQSICLPVTSTVTLGASPAATGGSGSYSYLWSPATNLSSATAANPTVTVSGATSLEYRLVVTDVVTGCTSLDSTHLSILAQPTVSVSSVDTDLCTGESAVLTAVGSPGGGTYQWAPLVNIVPGAGNTAVVTVTPTGTQTYQVIYFQGSCSDTAYKTVRVFPTPVASAGPNQNFCLPVASTITIGGNPTASSGSGIYRYTWSPATNLSSTTVANPTITTAVAGTTIYSVTVTDTVSGCTDVSSMTLTINPTATVTIAPGDTDICSGQTTTLTAIGSPAGGSYQWSPTFNMNPGLGNTASVIVAPSGTQRYQVTYTAAGCAGSTAVTVNVYTPVIAHAGIDQSFCLPFAGNIFLGSSSAATGGSGNYSYHWSPTTNLSDSMAPNPIVTKVNTNIEYYLTVTDNVTGCTSVDSSHLFIDTHATLSINVTDTNLCFGQSTVLTGVANPTGGSYQWAPIIYLNPGTGNTQSVTVSPISNQVYQLVYTRNGCRDTAYQNVYVYPVVVAHAGGDQTYCLPVSGSVTLGAVNTATGGSGSYTYAWYPNINLTDSTSSNPSLDSVVADTRKYYVLVTDAVTGCTAVDSMTLNIAPQTTVTVSSPKTDICLTESAILIAIGTPAGGNYQWNPIIAMTPANGNAQVVAVAPASGSQTYFVYYNLNGCRDTAAITVHTYAQPVANAGGNQTYCLPAPSIVRVGNPATGGSGNFTYRWSPGTYVSDSTIARPRVDSLTTPGAVTYTVTVTDNITGCISIDSAIITLTPKPVVTISSTDTSLCAGQTTTLTASGTPAGGSYQWQPSGFFTPPAGNTPTITTTPISNDVIYRVVYGTFVTFVNEDGDTITQATGCYDTAFQTVHVYPLVFAHAGGNQAFCLPVTGGITLGNNPPATGGSGHYIYTWSPALYLSDSTAGNPTVADTAAINIVYHLTVTDSLSGCTATDSARIIINPTSTVSISSADTNLCVGQNTTLTAIGAPPGGTYLWTPNAFITPSAANTASISVNPPSTITYTVTYTLANCSASATKTVNVYALPVAHAGPNKSFCAPDTSVQIGQVATGGSGSYTYLWASNPAGFNSTSATPTVTPTATTTTYYVTVTDAVSGCTSSDSVVVTKHNAPPVDAGPDQGICLGTTTQLIATGAQSYQWSPLVHMNPANGASPFVFVKPDTSTTYTVVGTDQFGCVASDTVRVRITPNLVVDIAPVTLCAGDSVHLVPNLLGPNYSYSWTPGSGLNCVSCASPLASPAPGNTVYRVVITDSITGCSGTDTVLVVTHSLPNSAFQAETKCVGDRVQFTDRSTSADPIASFFYNFGDTTTLSDTSHLRNPTYVYTSFAVHDAYQVVTTIYGCTDSSHVQVSSFPVVHADAGPDTAIALGGSVVMSANGGTTYTWANIPGLSSYIGASPTASPVITTVYYVTVTNDFGCSGVDSVKVTVVSLPDAHAGPDTFVCAGNPMVLQGFSKTLNVTYAWSPVLGLDSPNIAQPTVILNFPGVYQYVLKVTYFSNGIFVSAYDTMYLTVNPTPQITATPDSVNVCSGSPYLVNFNSSLASTTYSWTASNGTSGTGNIPATTVINNGITDSLIYYTVVGTVPGGCSDTIRVPVVVKPIPTLVVDSFPVNLCSGVNYVAAVHSNIPGAVIRWTSTLGFNNIGGNVNLVLNNPSNTPLTVIFTYTADYNGCASPALYDTVVVYPLPHADAGPDNTIPACSTDSIQIGGSPTGSLGTPGYTYSWTPTAGINGYTTAANPYVRHLGANTTYTVTVTDTNGCTASDAMNVIVTPATLAITISTNGPTTWCEGSGGSVDLTVNVTGGVAAYNYLWSPTAFLSDTFSQVVTASPDVAGTYPYTVLVTDASGCQASKSKTITVKALPHPAITGLNAHYCPSVASVPLTASIPGGSFSGFGVVNTGGGIYVFRPAQVGPGTYNITYTLTVNGCTHDTSQQVVVDTIPTVVISGNSATYCSLDSATTFTGTPAGGTWSGPGINPLTGLFNPSLVSIPNGSSTVITIRYHIATAGACSDSASVNITVNKTLTMTITASADTVCQGSATTLTPHYASLPIINTILWYDVNGTFITNNPNAITVRPTRINHGYYAVISSLQGCTFNDTIFIHTNQPPVANDDYDSTCLNTSFTFDVRANDTDTEGNVSTVRILKVNYGTATIVANNISYTPVYGYHGLDTVTYQICNVQCTSDCDTGRAYIYICPRNLPPTADTISYTAFQNAPHDVNVLLATSDPNGDPLTISLVGTYDPTLTITQTGNGAYTVTGTTVGTFPIVYQVCDTDQYPVHVLCDTAVIFANIIPVNTAVNHPPVANNDYATTTGIQPAIVNVRGNDTDPDGDPLSTPALNGSTVTAHGHFTVNLDGTVTFQPNGTLAQGIYYDTVSYCIYDITTVAPQPLTSCALLIVTTNVIDTPANRPPLAVDDHVIIAENTTSTINVKGNDSDPDGDALGTPTVLTATTSGTITSVSSNGDVVYVPNTGVHSVNGQPIDSFRYSVCDTLSIHGPSPLCDTAMVYVYITPVNLPPTADTIRYTQLVNTPHDVNVLLAVSDPNSDPLTISIISIPPGSGLTVTQTGNGAYTITGSIPGTYVITYQVCDTDQYPVHVLCATSVIVATITTPGGPNHPPVANNDYATTTGATPATVNVRGNDSDPDGNPLTIPTLIPGTQHGPGSFTVNADGTITLVPNSGLPNGIYYDSVAYQICDITTVAPQPLCATAWLIVTDNVVDTPISNRPPLAVDDHLTVAENSTNNALNVKANDSDPDGNPLTTPVIITGVVNGTITAVATNGDVTYTPVSYLHSINGQPVDSFTYVICDTLSAHGPAPLCDTAKAFIYVQGFNLPPVANDIYLNTPENTPIGVNVASGAYDPNGDPLTYTYPDGTGTTQGGTVVVTGNGSVNYFPPTGFIGVDSFAYSVCDTSPYPVHVLCDTAYVVINVTNPADTLVNHPPVATDDHTSTAPGASININVVANDSDPDGNPINVTVVTPATTSLGGTVSIGINNTVNYTAPAIVADSIVVDTFSYVLCDTNALHTVHVLCDTAFVYITINKFDTNIIHTNRPPVAVDDFTTLCEEDYSILNVLSNDIDPNGDPLTVTSILVAPTHGLAAVSSPSIVYLPALYFFGQDSLEYQVCDNRTPSLCDTAWVHYTVNLINHRPLAAQDTTSTSMQTAVNIPVTTNDFEPDGDSTTLSVVTPPIHGTATQVGNSYIYTPDAGYAGDDTFYYRMCDVMNPTAVYCATYTQLCDVGLVSIHVIHNPPHIPPTYDTIPQNSPPVTICPAVSGANGNGVHVTSFPCGPNNGTVGFATSDSCLTYVPNHDFTGDDTVCVVICDNVVPTLCDTDKVYIHVTPLCIPPVAVVDSYTVFHLVSSATLNVTANDTNHTTSALVVSVLTQPVPLGTVAVSGSNIRFTPNGTVGQAQFLYSICSVNPACTTCDTGIVYINVTGTPSTPPVAVNDSARIPQDSSVCVRVVTNDIPGTNPIQVTSACAPAHGTNSIAPNGYICYVPTHGFFGTDSFCYTICDNSVPALCSTATVYVIVTPNPHPPVAVTDFATTPQSTPVVIPVAGNDSDPDGNLNTGSVTLVSTPAQGSVTNIDPTTGAVTYVPNSTYIGVDSFRYSICDSTPVALGGPLCATATVYINVTLLNHPPHAPDTTVTIPQDSTILVCPSFSDPDAGQSVTVGAVCSPAHGTAVISGTGCVNYTPASSFYGTDSFCYVVCDDGSPVLCDTGIVTIVVTHVPHCPDAVADFVNGDSIGVVINELINDQYVGVIGVGYSVQILSGPDLGNTAVLNANGTITYTAAAGYRGVDHILYRVTDSLDRCNDTATITIFVVDTCVGPIAANDRDTVCEGSILSANVLANDYPGNSGNDTIIITANGAHGFAYLNTRSGNVEYVAAPYFHGLDTVSYQICSTCPAGAVMCSSAQLVVDVLITNHAPVAVDDTATMIEDHIDTINVVANDYDIDGDPLTVSISAQPTFGKLRLWNNQLIYTPNPDFCGTDTFGYQITGLNGSPLCPGQRAWDLGLVFVNVTCVNDTPVIPDTLVHVPEDSIITFCVPYTDPDAGDHHTFSVLCAPTHGIWISAPAVTDTPALVCMTYKPDTNFYGIDHACIILCDNGTPALCDTSYITIVVDPRNEPPVVQDQHVSTPKGVPVGVNISTGAFDPNGDPITYIYPNSPSHGTWTPDAHINGTGVYTPNDPACPPVGGTCSDSFTVIVCDNSPYFVNVLCDTATIFVTIYDTTGTPNHAPVANTDYAVTDTTHGIIVYVAANDLDPDGDQLTIPNITPGPTAHGNIGYNASNQVVYSPTGPFTTPITIDSFVYSICDTNAAH